jgi:hypothetical protein
MNAMEYNDLLSRAVNRGLKEGVAEGKIDMLQLVGALELQKGALLDLMVGQAKHAASSPIVVPPARMKLPGT